MTFSIKDIQERYAVGEHTVLRWIHQGELKAYSVSRSPGGKPKWRINAEALEAFELSRTPTPPLTVTRRRSTQAAGVVEFYK